MAKVIDKETKAGKKFRQEIEKLKALMKVASSQLDFEKAIEIRDTISQLKKKLLKIKKQ